LSSSVDWISALAAEVFVCEFCSCWTKACSFELLTYGFIDCLLISSAGRNRPELIGFCFLTMNSGETYDSSGYMAWLFAS
jgi:hypothetical protein